MKPEDFKQDNKVRTTILMTEEDVGQDIPVGTICTIMSEPNDDEELVQVMVDGSMNFLPQYVFEPVKIITLTQIEIEYLYFLLSRDLDEVGRWKGSRSEEWNAVDALRDKVRDTPR